MHLPTLAAAAALVLGLQSAHAADVTHRTIKGLYFPQKLARLYTKPGEITKDDSNYSLALGKTDGVYLVMGWCEIEPDHAGGYDFAKLDAAIAEAVAAGRKISIGVRAGGTGGDEEGDGFVEDCGTPQWLLSEMKANGETFAAKIEMNRRFDFCKDIDIPLPWSPTFKSHWKALIAELGARYRDVPSLTMVKMTGINYQSDEAQLPRRENRTINIAPDRTYDDYLHQENLVVGPDGVWECAVPSSIAQWLRKDYRPHKIQSAFEEFLAAYKAAFPNMPLTLMGGDGSFPAITDDGLAQCTHIRPNGIAFTDEECVAAMEGRQPCAPTDPVCMAELDRAANVKTDRMVPYAHQQLKVDGTTQNLFVMQANSLKVGNLSPSTLAYRYGYTGRTGYQSAWFVVGDTVCRMANVPGITCPAKDALERPALEYTVMRDVLSTGINDGQARYLEVLRPDILNPSFAPLIAAAKSMLGYEDSWPVAQGVAYIKLTGLIADAVDFRRHGIDNGPKEKIVTIRNLGALDLRFDGIHAVADTSLVATPMPFAIKDTTCANVLASNATCTVTVTFDPAAAGSHHATLQVLSNDPITPRKRVDMIGEGI